MFTDYANFEIDIQPRAGDYFPLSVRSPGGEARGALRLPSHDPTFARLLDRLSALESDEDQVDQIGQLLFGALFQGAVKEVYNRSQGTLEPGQGLRIKLLVAPTEREVAALPWEYLNDPDLGPLTLRDAPVVRYLPLSKRIALLKTKLPLKVLLTGAQIDPASAVERELHEVESALTRLGEQVQITIEPHLTFEKLQRRLRAGFDVWHFAGKGGFSADGATGQIYLEGAAGGRPIGAQQLDKLLNGSRVRLVLLDTCDSARPAAEPFHSLAPALVRAGVPAVIAMQFQAPETTTRVFAKEFFLALAEGFPIDACMTEGRKAIMGAAGLSRADWGIPVVYTHSPDGRLFDLPTPAVPTYVEKIVATPSGAGAIAAQLGVHDAAGTILSAPAPLDEPRKIAPAAPSLQLDFLDRAHEQHDLLAILKPGAGAWLWGEPGCGLTAFSNQVAARAQGLPDGTLCVEGQREPSDRNDLLQRLFEHFYLPSTNMRVDPGTAQTYLSRVRALCVLDRLDLGYQDLLWLARNALPNSAVLIAADGEAPSALYDQPLAGLPRAEAIALCAATARLDATQPQVAAQLDRICAALGDLPLPLVLVARLARQSTAPVAQLAAVLEERVGREPGLIERVVGQPANIPASWPPNHAVANDDSLTIAAQLALETLSPGERAILEIVVVGRPDIHLAAITERTLLRAPAARIALRRLAELGLIVGSADRYEIASVSLRRALEDLLQPEQARRGLAAYYAANAQLYAGDLSWLKRERGNILAAIETLQAAGKTAQAGALAKTLQPSLVLGGLWGSWGKVIDLASAAARQSHDRALEAWAQHERGTRAGLLGDRDTAARSLRQALRLRRQLGDQTGAAVTTRNMAYLELFLPIPPHRGWRDTLRRHPRILGALAGLAALGAITMAVTALSPTAPLLVDDRADTTEDQPVTVAVAANDSARRGALEQASLRVIAQPANGVATVDPAAATIMYTPKPNFAGTDRLTYQICDSGGECASAAVVVTVSAVNDPPTAADDQASVAEDTALTIDVTANDTDVEDQRLAVRLDGTSSQAGGALSASGSMVTYTPPTDFNGADSFVYTVVDRDGGHASATVSVFVGAVNDQPSFTKGPDQSVDEDAEPQALAWAKNISSGPPDEAAQSLTFEVASSNPELFAAQPAIDSAGKLTYSPAPDRFGEATVTVTLHDGGGTADGGADSSPPQTFAIVVRPANDQPVAADDAVQATEDQPLEISVASLLANDRDRDGDALSLTAADTPTERGGIVSLAGDRIVYTPPTDFNGADTFSYMIDDGQGGTDRATVTLAVAPVNDSPIAVDDTRATDEDVPLVIPGAELTANDHDPDGDQLTVTVVGTPSAHGGTVTLAEDTITYTPPAGYSGEDRFSYTVGDGSVSVTGTVVVTVTHVNHNPEAGDHSFKGIEDQALTIRTAELLSNDRDRDGDQLSVTAVSASSDQGGTVQLARDTIAYTPAPDFNGRDTFSYTIDDGHGGTAQAAITVVVAPVNDQPVAGDDAASTVEGKPLPIPAATLLANDTDVDRDPLIVAGIDGKSDRGGVVKLSDGVVTYTPPQGIIISSSRPQGQNFVGVDTFSYKVCDNGQPALCDTAVVTVTVQANPPPTISNISATPDPIDTGSECSNPVTTLTVQADVSDDTGVREVVVIYHYRTNTTIGKWLSIAMVPNGSGSFVAKIDVGGEADSELRAKGGWLDYQVTATDNDGKRVDSNIGTVKVKGSIIC